MLETDHKISQYKYRQTKYFYTLTSCHWKIHSSKYYMHIQNNKCLPCSFKEENKETKEGQWPNHSKNSLITTIIKQKSQTINLPMGSNLEMSLEFILLIVIKIYFKDW